MKLCSYASNCQYRLKHGDQWDCTDKAEKYCNGAAQNSKWHPMAHILRMPGSNTACDALLIARQIGGTPAAIAAIDQELVARSKAA